MCNESSYMNPDPNDPILKARQHMAQDVLAAPANDLYDISSAIANVIVTGLSEDAPVKITREIIKPDQFQLHFQLEMLASDIKTRSESSYSPKAVMHTLSQLVKQYEAAHKQIIDVYGRSHIFMHLHKWFDENTDTHFILPVSDELKDAWQRLDPMLRLTEVPEPFLVYTETSGPSLGVTLFKGKADYLVITSMYTVDYYLLDESKHKAFTKNFANALNDAFDAIKALTVKEDK